MLSREKDWLNLLKSTLKQDQHWIIGTFPSADRVGKLTVFNIGGNKARLIAAVHYNRKIIYIRHVLTHNEYDRGTWKE